MSARRIAVLVTALAATTAACASTPSEEATANRPRRTTTTTSTTTSPPTTTTTPFAGLRPGDSGPAVVALQQRLIELRYDIPTADGSYGDATFQAVMAFQKANGLSRDGIAGPQTFGALSTASTPAPLVPGGGSTRVEIDIARQVLFFYKNDALYRIVAVSSGNGARYCVGGSCATALTPGGSFRVRAKVNGWQTGRLGRLYKPSYFNGNIAIHGALSVPGYPASHGCVRVPMTSADWIYASLPIGTPVYVLNGPKAPAPFGDAPPISLAPDADQRPGDEAPGAVPAPTTAPPPPPTTAPPATTTTSTSTTATAPPGP